MGIIILTTDIITIITMPAEVIITEVLTEAGIMADLMVAATVEAIIDFGLRTWRSVCNQQTD